MIFIEPGVTNTNTPTVIFDSIIIDSTVTFTSQETGFGAVNTLGVETYSWWKPTAADVVDGTSQVQYTLSTPSTADCAFIESHDLGTIGATVEIQYFDVSWKTAASITPSDNSPIMILFPEQSSSNWRVEVSTTSQYHIGIVLIGNRLVFPTGVDSRYTSFVHSGNFEIMGGNSLGGQFLGQKVIRKGGNTSLIFPLLDTSFVDNDMLMFENHYNTGQPFGFATKPNAFAGDLGYCWRPDNSSELKPKYRDGSLYQEFTMNVDFYNA